MARKRTIILIKSADTPPPANGAGGSGGGGLLPMGTCDQVIAAMASHNISPDGSGQHGRGESLGMATLYGPGFIVELPAGGGKHDELTQAMVTLTDEDFAWPVLSRLCKIQKWKMMDPDSGRTFG